MHGSATAVATRLFEAADLRALFAIEDACFTPPLRFSRGLIRSLVMDSNCRTWVGTVEGAIVGFAIVSLSGELTGDGEPSVEVALRAAYLWTIEVLPGFRRMGVARALLGRVEESARDAGREAVELHVSERNTGGLALYEAVGYWKIAVEAEYYGRREDAFRYRKGLVAEGRRSGVQSGTEN